MHNNLIILAGGASSRMKKPATSGQLSIEEEKQANQRTKGLIGIGPENRPLLDFLLNNAKKAGYKHIYFIVGKNNQLFREFYGQKDNGNNGWTCVVTPFMPSARSAARVVKKGRIEGWTEAAGLLKSAIVTLVCK